jgi:hypothetical protein
VRECSESDLQVIARFVNGRQFLRFAALLEAVLGAALVGFSIAGILRGSSFCLIPTGVGILTFVAGLLQRRSFSVALTVLEVALLGAFGLLVGAMPLIWWLTKRVQTDWMPEMMGLALILLVGSIFGIARLTVAIRAQGMKLTAEQSEIMNELLLDLANSDPVNDSRAASYSTIQHGEPFVWRGILFDQFCVFVRQREPRMLVARPTDFRFEDRGPGWLGSNHRIRLRIGRCRFKGTAGTYSCDNLQKWLAMENS